MGTKVAEIFGHFDLTINGQVKWNEEVFSNKCGVYVIALTSDKNEIETLSEPLFNDSAIDNWIKLVAATNKSILVDKKQATTGLLKERLSKFWLPDETIVYIGKAGPTKKRTLKKRVNEFYETKLGCNKKHAGGHWLNTLKNINALNIFYSETDPSIEEKMIEYFRLNVSEKTKERLLDQENCFPFANKEKNKSERKKHGILNQTIDCGNKWKK